MKLKKTILSYFDNVGFSMHQTWLEVIKKIKFKFKKLNLI